MWWWWQAAYRALKPGGVLVFADRAFDERWEAYMRSGRAEAEAFWDVGHPCAVKQTLIDHFLAPFVEVYSRRYTKQEPRVRGRGRRAPTNRDEQLYFIGRKPL